MLTNWILSIQSSATPGAPRAFIKARCHDNTKRAEEYTEDKSATGIHPAPSDLPRSDHTDQPWKNEHEQQ
jgi:hypothetical protein